MCILENFRGFEAEKQGNPSQVENEHAIHSGRIWESP